MPVKTFFFNYMAKVERIMDDVYALLPNIESGGEPFQPPLRTSFTNLLLLYQHASLSACKPQRKVLFGTQLYKPMAFFHLFLFPEKGGRGLVRTIFILTTQVLVHLQLQVRGGVSLGQYYSTVRAIHSPRVYIKIIISLGCRPPRGVHCTPL